MPASTRRTCPSCQTQFFPYPGPSSPLCRECRQAEYRKRKNAAAQAKRASATKPIYDLTCEACGQPFQASRRRHYCDRVGGRRQRNTTRMRKYLEGYERRTGEKYVPKRSPEARQRDSAERRARKRGARVGAPFTRQYVGERDSWQCALCGEPINPTLKWPDPMSQSLEHIVPLALGGEHSKENCTIAHLSCNSRGGTRHAQARARMLRHLEGK